MASRPKIIKKYLCHKTKYDSKAEAMRALDAAKRRGLRCQRAYKCQSGNHWHLTSQVKGGLPVAV